MIRASSFALSAAAAFLLGVALAHSAPSNTLSTPRSGLDVAAIERSVIPGDDFFRFANGAWLNATEIPPTAPCGATAHSSSSSRPSVPRI